MARRTCGHPAGSVEADYILVAARKPGRINQVLYEERVLQMEHLIKDFKPAWCMKSGGPGNELSLARDDVGVPARAGSRANDERKRLK
ncbi:MAG: hypothetical protein R2751_15025 [Bacteroidales bacterium]